MGIKFKCVCGSIINAPDSAGGKKGKCQKCGVVFIVPTIQPTQTGVEIQRPFKTSDAYVNSCFNLDFRECEETRMWANIDKLKEIPQLFQAGKKDKARELVETALVEYSDYDFVYIWMGNLLEDKKQPQEALKIYHLGIRECRSKAYLCDNIGQLALERKDLPEAVKWLIKSCAVQLGGGKAQDAISFINLGYIAEGLGLPNCAIQLFEWGDAIDPRQIRFDAVGVNYRHQLASTQGTPSIKQAIRAFCQFRPYAESLDRQYPTWREEQKKRQESQQIRQKFEKVLETSPGDTSNGTSLRLEFIDEEESSRSPQNEKLERCSIYNKTTTESQGRIGLPEKIQKMG